MLEGRLRFTLGEATFDADAGTTVFVPAGVPHTFCNPGPDDVRYLIVSTARVFALIDALHDPANEDPASVSRAYGSEIVG